MNLSPLPLSPSMHWGQLHRQEPTRRIARRIYDFEWLLLLEGKTEVRIGDEEPFPAAPGQLYLLPARTYHEVSVQGERTAVFLGIHFDFYDELHVARDEDIIVNENAVREGDFCAFPGDPALAGLLLPGCVDSAPDIENLMRETIDLFTRKEPLHNLLCKGNLLRLMAAVAERRRTAGAGFHSPHEADIRRLALRIEASPGEDWSNARLAGMLSLNEDYMIRLFGQILGASPGSFVQRARHREAKRLLRETDATIESVGSAAGYASLHYFSRAFARLEGITASEYRKLSRML